MHHNFLTTNNAQLEFDNIRAIVEKTYSKKLTREEACKRLLPYYFERLASGLLLAVNRYYKPLIIADYPKANVDYNDYKEYAHNPKDLHRWVFDSEGFFYRYETAPWRSKKRFDNYVALCADTFRLSEGNVIEQD